MSEKMDCPFALTHAQGSGLPYQGPMLYHPFFHDAKQARRFNFWKYYEVLKRRKRWILGFILIVVPLWTLVTFLRTPIFRATTMVQITSDNPASIVTSKENPSPPINREERQEFAQTQFKILQSRSVAERIIEKLNLKNHPEFRKGLREGMDADASMKLMVDRFLKKLDVSPEKNSFLVRVSFESEDPILAQNVTNALVQEYTQFGMESRSHAFGAVQKWLDYQLQVLRAKVESSERQLYSFAEKSNVINPENKDNVVLQKYTDLSNLLTKAESERVAKESQYKQIKEGGLDSSIILNNPLTMKLREELVIQEAKVASLGRVYKSGHPEMQTEQAKAGQLRARLNAEIKRLASSIKADYESAKRTEEMLQQNLNEQKERVAKLQRQTVDYKILKRDVDANDALYKGLLARMKEASIASTMIPTNVQVIDEAERPLTPVRPNKALNLVFASLLGIFGGIGLAFLVERLDDSIKSAEELEEMSKLPVLSLVPALESSNNNNLHSLPEPQIPSLNYLQNYGSEMSESIRQLKTIILLSDLENPPKVLLITSPNPGEGKTTVAVNLACSLAVQGRKVLLIDADLRRPQLHKVFQKPVSPGLSDFLHEICSPSQIIHATELPSLFVIPAGRRSSVPAEIIGSQDMAIYIKKIGEHFDHVILDSPPILGCTEGLMLSASADGVILVVRHLSTSVEAGRLAQQFLQKVKAPLIGSVINYANYKDFGYHYYYKYYGEKFSHHGDKPFHHPNNDEKVHTYECKDISDN
ncbi:MAG: polysaccharide biosynthesis tyrosine autokinase [Deltaproteobacteria bacterium]|nr:polysaccharide biosynthesis tyrosine autokinase [Deltaproteobacteria bacterium]